ncbi:MAG: hypothetical protein WD875_13315 [Pirellulales bacterium]
MFSLLAFVGVAAKKRAEVFGEFVKLASGTPLVKKLARAVTFVAAEGADFLKSSRFLGANSWSQVTATLDASVAIPYLCASLFRPTSGRFSRSATTCIQILKAASTQLVIPRAYINEVASHLYAALRYPEMPEYKESLEHSQNGFVSYYYQLRAQAAKAAPETLRAFVGQFSLAARRNHATSQHAIREIMADIQPLCFSYGVKYDDITQVPIHFRRDVETGYMFRMKELHRNKTQRLIDHDVEVLSHARRAISERNEIRMCLTWDAVMIAVGRELLDCGWIVSPHEACDVVQVRTKLSVGEMSALAHGLARARERPLELGARIIDRVVQLASEQLEDWSFRNRLRQFYEDSLKRIDISGGAYNALDQDVDEFLMREGVSIEPPDIESGEISPST